MLSPELGIDHRRAALDVHLESCPPGGHVRHAVRRLRVVVVHLGHQVVPEGDAPAPDDVCRVALEDLDLTTRVGPLQQQCGVQAGWAAADADDLHSAVS